MPSGGSGITIDTAGRHSGRRPSERPADEGDTAMPRKPDFDNLLAVLRREKPSRPTLYEFVMNERLYRRLLGLDPAAPLEAKEHVPSWFPPGCW
jgi:hypothetical protein